MCRANEESNQKCKPEKSELLPTGDKAKELIEVLAAMYRAMHNPEDTPNDKGRSKLNQWRDTGPEKEGEERGVDR